MRSQHNPIISINTPWKHSSSLTIWRMMDELRFCFIFWLFDFCLVVFGWFVSILRANFYNTCSYIIINVFHLIKNTWNVFVPSFSAHDKHSKRSNLLVFPSIIRQFLRQHYQCHAMESLDEFDRFAIFVDMIRQWISLVHLWFLDIFHYFLRSTSLWICPFFR